MLTRDEFRAAVFERDNYKCVACGAPAADAHHIIERRLWPDGGYYLDNGASVCGPCHLRAESTLLSAQELRDLAGIKQVLPPPQLYADLEYDKWANIIDGDVRYPGPLFYDESVQKVIKPVLAKFKLRFKYPRTWHLPWSNPGKNDRKLADTSCFDGMRVVQSEKMDGENTTVYWDGYTHARSIDDTGHPSRNWLKRYIQDWAYELPQGWRVCGEYLYAKHTIPYDDLDSYFQVFSIWNGTQCLSWPETTEWCQLLGLTVVPHDTLTFDVKEVKKFRGREGYVVRNYDSFDYKDFHSNVAKYVSPKFNPAGSHWKHKSVVPNKLEHE